MIAHRQHDHRDPWHRDASAVLMLHGNAETSDVWYAWPPSLGRSHRLVLPDLPGFGGSPGPATDDGWLPEAMAEELADLVRILDLQQVDVVGCKFGGAVAVALALRDDVDVRTISLMGVPLSATHGGGSVDPGRVPDMIRRLGVREWAARTMTTRLGRSAQEGQVNWMVDLMAGASTKACLEVAKAVAGTELEDLLPRLDVPALVVTAEGNPMSDLTSVRRWVDAMPRGELAVVPGDGYHVAAMAPDACAHLVSDFLARHDTLGTTP